MHPTNKTGILLSTILFTCLVFGIGIWSINNYMKYEQEHPENSKEYRIQRDQSKFDFLMLSGQIKMDDGRYDEALTQFELALDIIPNDSMANVRILECSRLTFSKFSNK